MLPAANASISSGVSTALMLSRAFTVSVSCFFCFALALSALLLVEAALAPSCLPSKGAKRSGLSALKQSCQST